MANTPEGRVKAGVNALLATYEGVYVFMPVPFGYGATTLDYLGCFRGAFFAIETKVAGEKPTKRQGDTIREIEKSMGAVFVIAGEGDEPLLPLKSWLDRIEKAVPYDPRFSPAPRARRPI